MCTVSSVCYAHSYTHKPPKPVALTTFMLEKTLNWNVLVLSIPIDWPKKKYAMPTLKPITLKSVYHPHNYILRSRVGSAFHSLFAACISPSPFGSFVVFWVHINLYTLAEGRLISVRSLQSSEGDVSDQIKYIYSWSA